ncbi:DUF2332 domain-containing protein [Leekyejoonella antrihumi]|uniref:DUF2332 domain-containing protein n=1 Tax=Leekyejoonella antrihumi TaxID=1660198 RepID=A0A563DV63_9MICO|nr:DUF2332 domain-containing protein [Leekyejoonella antrihumi]TWP33812.1 DUF2332 domain-containing protein [Leekyejoonella antrihumi]
MADPSLADQFRSHFGHRDHLYGVLLGELADDLDAGGVTARICEGYDEVSRGAAVQLRLLAGIFRIVLRGDAPALERFYPSLGGTADPRDAWPAFRPVLERHVGELHDALAKPPQTNEVGRSACLVIGLFEAVRRTGLRRIRLLEPGASAGLNLNVDRYRMVGPAWSWGPGNSPVCLDTKAVGVRPEPLTIIERRGCDLDPVDASTSDGGRYLTSYVWPFDLDRHRRLATALEVVREHPVSIERLAASEWLDRQLADDPGAEVLTVVWQSITQQYWAAAESARVQEIVGAGRAQIALAHITMEGVPPAQTGGGYDIATQGPELALDGEVIARSHHHGPPIVLS